MLIDLKKNYAFMFKVLKSINIFESTNRFIYEHIRIDLPFQTSTVLCVFTSYCVIFPSLVARVTLCINSHSLL